MAVEINSWHEITGANEPTYIVSDTEKSFSCLENWKLHNWQVFPRWFQIGWCPHVMHHNEEIPVFAHATALALGFRNVMYMHFVDWPIKRAVDCWAAHRYASLDFTFIVCKFDERFLKEMLIACKSNVWTIVFYVLPANVLQYCDSYRARGGILQLTSCTHQWYIMQTCWIGCYACKWSSLEKWCVISFDVILAWHDVTLQTQCTLSYIQNRCGMVRHQQIMLDAIKYITIYKDKLTKLFNNVHNFTY